MFDRHSIRLVYELRHCLETWPEGGNFEISPGGLVRRDKIPYLARGYLPIRYLQYMRRCRREHAKAVCGAWLGFFNFMAMKGHADAGFDKGFAAGRYDALKSDT